MDQQHFDIVTIGAGLGGLAEASLLSRKGYKTLVVESRNRVGGRFSTIDHEGFKLTTGAICLHRDGWVVKLMKDMEIDLDLLRPVSRLFYRIDGKDYEIPHEGRLKVILELIERSEEEHSDKREWARHTRETKRILSGLKEAMGGVFQEGLITLRDWLLQYTENEKAHELFDQLSVSLLMAHAWELPVHNFFRFLAETGGMRDFYLATQGNLTIAKGLVGVVEENGAVWTNCTAKRIAIQGGKATGVFVDLAGTEIEIPCKVVISDVGPRMTVHMAGTESFDQEYLKNMRLKLRPSPSLLLHVASDRPLCLEGNPALLTIMGGRRIGGVVPISNICPELTPPGQHLLYASAEPLSSLRPMDRKYEFQQCLRDLKEMFPDFEKHGRVLSMKPCDVNNEWPEGRTWAGYGLPLKTSVSNLFNVGDACLAPGLVGTSGAVETGYRVVEMVEEEVKNR
jgi:phytoene dehydrogenase-like protein